MKYFIANWKSNKNLAEVQAWQAAVPPAPTGITCVVCPVFTHLAALQKLEGWQLGVQTLSAFPNGAYTGAVSAAQAAEFAQFAILGHAERRKYFGESSQMVAQQVSQAVSNKITPIIAVDDHNWAEQLGFLSDAELGASLVMYEPPSAISGSGSSGAVDVEDVKTAVEAIKKQYTVKGFLYGGSVNQANIASYFVEPLSGVVVGNASLDPAKVQKMLAAL